MYKNLIIFTIFITMFMIGISIATKCTTNQSRTAKSNEKVISTPKQTIKSYNDNTPKVCNVNEEVTSTSEQTTNQYNVYTPSKYNANKLVANIAVINLVMDYSGSMGGVIEEAKSVMGNVIAKIPASTQVGLRVFGPLDEQTRQAYEQTYKQAHEQAIANLRAAEDYARDNNTIEARENLEQKIKEFIKSNPDCSATQQVTKISRANANLLLTGMNSVNVGGGTPMVYALDRAIYQDLVSFDRTSTKKIILITDGGENCGDDPCDFVKNLVAQRRDIIIDVILVGRGNKNLDCLTNTTGGTLYTIDDLSSLQTVLTKSMTTKPKEVGNTHQCPCSKQKPTNYGITETEHKF